MDKETHSPGNSHLVSPEQEEIDEDLKRMAETGGGWSIKEYREDVKQSDGDVVVWSDELRDYY